MACGETLLSGICKEQGKDPNPFCPSSCSSKPPVSSATPLCVCVLLGKKNKTKPEKNPHASPNKTNKQTKKTHHTTNTPPPQKKTEKKPTKKKNNPSVYKSFRRLEIDFQPGGIPGGFQLPPRRSPAALATGSSPQFPDRGEKRSPLVESLAAGCHSCPAKPRRNHHRGGDRQQPLLGPS